METQRIAAHLLVKDEDDIIEECINHISRYCDYIFVLDNGSTDGTYKICKNHPRVNYCMQQICTFSDSLRNHLLEVSREYLRGNIDWFLALSADHFFVTDPREDIRRAAEENSNVITYDVAQYYLTNLDYTEEIKEKGDWMRKPIEERIKFYAINYFDFPVAFRFTTDLLYKEEVTEWPVLKSKKVASFKPILKHYQFRSIEQLQKRLALRKQEIQKGFKGFRHYRSYEWENYIFDANRLHYFDGVRWEIQKKPTLDELLCYVPPLSDRLKKHIRKILKSK
jgi:glycosyltransferase involved in cell wall biosynthesis